MSQVIDTGPESGQGDLLDDCRGLARDAARVAAGHRAG